MESLSLFGSIPATIDHQGVRYMNPAKRHQKPFWLRSAAATINANSTTRTTLSPPRDQGDDGDAEIFYFTGQSTGAFAVRLFSGILEKYFSNQPVESSLLFGSANLPGRTLRPIWLPATSVLQAELTDLSASGNTVSLVGIGHQVLQPEMALGLSRDELARREQARQEAVHPFWLTFDDGAQVSLAGNETKSFTLTCPSDAYFLYFALLLRATSNSLEIEIKEGARRSMMSTGDTIPVDLVAARTLSVTGFPNDLVPAASLPLILPFTGMLEPKSTLTVRLKDTSGSTNKVSLAFPGELAYYPLAPGGLNHLNATPGVPGIQPAPGLLQGVRHRARGR